MNRFGKVALNIQNQSLDVAMHQMVTTLRPGPFTGNYGASYKLGQA